MRKRNGFAALYELIDRHIPCAGTVPVFIADRGFHAYNVFAHAIENSAFFAIRATDAKMKRLLGADLPKEDTFDLRVTRHLTRSQPKKKYLRPESPDQYRYIFLRLHLGEGPPDVEGLIRKHTLPVRPDRNFARQQRFQVPVSFTYRF